MQAGNKTEKFQRNNCHLFLLRFLLTMKCLKHTVFPDRTKDLLLKYNSPCSQSGNEDVLLNMQLLRNNQQTAYFPTSFPEPFPWLGGGETALGTRLLTS